MRPRISTILIFLAILSAIITSYASPKEKKFREQITIGEPIAEGCDSTSEWGEFQSVELPPEYPGGPEAMKGYIKSNRLYPQEAMERGIEGRVIVQFTVDSTGNICKEDVVRSIDPQLDGEVIRIARSMPKWKLGEIRGKPTRMRFSFPVTFRLKE